MDAILELWKNQWAAYPEWLVVSSVAIAGGVVLWLLARVFGWIMKWVLICTVMVLVTGAVLYLLSV